MPLERSSRYDFSKVSCLLVEDNVKTATLVRAVLSPLNLKQLHLVRDGRAALDVLSAAPVDFCLVDWNTQPMNGLEFLRHVRSFDDGSTQFMPFIMLTAHTERDRVIQARDNGVDCVVAKPFAPSQLFQRITSIVERKYPFIRCSDYFGPLRMGVDTVPPPVKGSSVGDDLFELD